MSTQPFGTITENDVIHAMNSVRLHASLMSHELSQKTTSVGYEKRWQIHTMTKDLYVFVNLKTMKVEFEVQIQRSQETEDDWDMIDDEYEMKFGMQSKTFQDLNAAIEFYNAANIIGGQ